MVEYRKKENKVFETATREDGYAVYWSFLLAASSRATPSNVPSGCSELLVNSKLQYTGEVIVTDSVKTA
jgi:hypothetical protein